MSYSDRRAIGKAVIGVIGVIAIAVAAIGLYMVSSNTGSPDSSVCNSKSASNQTPVQVSIYNGSGNSANPPGYTPDTITLVIGVNNTVTWTNNDSVHHTVTSTGAPSGGLFNSGNMNAGAACTHTFTVPGTYNYDCVYHSWMTGTIIVKASS
jgi:plastocyanin